LLEGLLEALTVLFYDYQQDAVCFAEYFAVVLCRREGNVNESSSLDELAEEFGLLGEQSFFQLTQGFQLRRFVLLA